MVGRAFKFIAILVALQFAVFGQTFRGGISGTVVDQTGATIAGAEVKLLGSDTGLTRSVESTSAGEFVFQDLPLGKYSISVTHAGFQTETVNNINIEAGKIFNLQAKLSVSSQATEVQVEANAAEIETSSTAITSIISTKTMNDVPLNGRDFTQLLKLNPGVTPSGSVNGTRTNSIDWQIDGTDNNDQWHNSAAVNQGGVSGIAGTLLPIDAIDEFSMQTESSAEQGRNGGGVLNLVIKSGTNQFHGSAYYFNRNEVFASRNWFVAPGSPTTELRNSQPGGSLGGPILKNKFFFFMTYEQQNYVAGQTALGTTPSASWVSQAQQVMARDGVPVNPLALTLLSNLWPANSLSGPATQNNYVSSANNISNSYNGIAKVDYIFNEKNNISFRWFGGTGAQTEYVGSAMPYYFQTAPSRMQNYNLVYNAVINPHFVSQTLAGVNYFKQVFGDATAGFNMVALGFNTGVTNPSLFYAPNINIRGFDSTGETPPLGRIDTTGQLNQIFTYTEGKHQFRFGGGYRRSRLDVFYNSLVPGTFNFDGSQGPFAATNPTDTWGVGNSPIASSLNSLADFLSQRVGINQAAITSGDLQRNYYLNDVTGFAQDSWKITPNLTLNIGLNWNYQSPINDPTNRISTFIPSQGGIVAAGVNSSLWPRDWTDFGPRFGFAYQPGSSGKLVVRGGYGIFYQVPNVNYFGNNHPPNGGATGILANPGGIAPIYTLSNSAPLDIQTGVPIFGSTAFPPPPYNAFSVSQNFTTAYVQNFNANAQYQINRSLVFEVGYIGSLSRHLPTTLDINQIPVGSPEVNSSRPYYGQFPTLGVINQVESVANGYYNGMILSLTAVNYHGLNVKLNYTLGHARDDLSGARGIIPQNSYCLRCDYGNSDFDVRNTFVTYISYALPNPSKWKPLLGGWQLNALLTFNSGTPFTVFSGTDSSLTGENNDRAQVVGNPFQGVPASSPAAYRYWFNPAAFTLPTPGTYSNQGRNQYYGPGTSQVDFSIFKNFQIKERLALQLRAEMFNLFNTVNLSGPNTTVTSSGLGQITSTQDVGNGAPGIGVGAPFNVQLGAKITF
jgi:Carboxypeptidase regulatory-like domain